MKVNNKNSLTFSVTSVTSVPLPAMSNLVRSMVVK